MNARIAILTALAGLTVLGGCRSEGDIVVDTGVGITALRSVCPAVGVPDYTGDVTLFSPADARTADAIDVSAAHARGEDLLRYVPRPHASRVVALLGRAWSARERARDDRRLVPHSVAWCSASCAFARAMCVYVGGAT